MSTAVATAPSTAPPRRVSLAHFGPNWFSTVMGTGIVANAAATLPFDAPGLDTVAKGLWILAASLLVVLLGATAAHWMSHPANARGHLEHPAMAHFYGAPAMALMTVGSGTVLVGDALIGSAAATDIAMILWIVGTGLGLWTTWAVPRRTLRQPSRYTGPAFGGWLIPVVPAMVSAASGALLVPRLPAAVRPAMIGGCSVLFLVALVASVPILVIIVRGVLRGHLLPSAAPLLFIVLGPLGQSATAAHALGEEAGGPWDVLGFAYGATVLAAAVIWLVIAIALTARAARTGLPFTLAWWSFTFPIGTLVTGTSGLAAYSDARVLESIAGVLFVVLLIAWATVATLTLRRVSTGRLLAAQTA